MRTHTIRRLAVLALLAIPAAAGSSDASFPTALERSLDIVRADGIRADVHFLASDELEGRDTPSRGLRVAARFLRARLERLGWQPGAGDSYFHEYELMHRAIDGKRSELAFVRDGERVQLSFGDDYFFTSWELGDHAISAGAVTVGTGTRDEIEAVDVTGKWAICLDADVHSSARRNALRRAGAKGVLIVPVEGEPLLREDRIKRQARTAARGRIEMPGGERRGARAGSELHQVYLASTGAAKLRRMLGSVDLSIPGVEVDLVVEERRRLPGDGGIITAENVCGFLPGSDPILGREVVIVSAHYDHIGVNAQGIFNGADDNASGSAGLLALADALLPYAEAGKLRRSVLLIWVSAEEKGLFGSEAWVADPTLPPGHRPVCGINIDMIGRNAPDYLLITPSKSHSAHNGLVKLADELGPLEGFPSLGSADRYYERSDHYNFARLGIPVAFLFNGEHEDYHRTTDTPDKVDPDKIRRVVRLVTRMIDAMQTDTLRL